MLDAGILQADGIQNSGRCLGSSVRWIPQAWFEGGSFQAHGPDITVGKALHPRIFFAKADAAGKQYQRRCQPQATEVQYQLLAFRVSQRSHRVFSKGQEDVPRSVVSAGDTA